MDKATLEFFIRDGLAAHAHQTGIVAGERAEIIVESVVQRLWPEVEKSRAEVERLRSELRERVLGELFRYESGLDCAGALEYSMFEDWRTELRDGKATVAETVYRIIMRLNHTNGNADIALNVLQLLTGESEPIAKYDCLSDWTG